METKTAKSLTLQVLKRLNDEQVVSVIQNNQEVNKPHNGMSQSLIDFLAELKDEKQMKDFIQNTSKQVSDQVKWVVSDEWQYRGK
ncbi:MAG: hypothetical protein MSL80_01615 [Helicobacter sp.]|uniref:hypothetical protein n=1 Tax=Helicobacter sp. TaxID=218 RepID=UPI0037534155|nr:hypothetical protein [Helicobacter sp.]